MSKVILSFLLIVSVVKLITYSGLFSGPPTIIQACLSEEEGCTEKPITSKTENGHEDKLYLTHVNAVLSLPYIESILHAYHPDGYSSFIDQPNTPPPNFHVQL